MRAARHREFSQIACSAGEIDYAIPFANAYPVQRVAAADVPTPYARNLEKLALPDAQDIVDAVLKITL